MKKALKPKYSFAYYRKTKAITFLAIALSCLLLFSIFSIFSYSQALKSEHKTLSSESSKIEKEISDTLEIYTSLCLSLSDYKNLSPVFQEETNVNLRKATLDQEIKTMYSSHKHIRNIEVVMKDYISQVQSNSDKHTFTTFAEFDTYNISYSDLKSWPKLFKIECSSKTSEPYNVSISLYSENLCSSYITGNKFLIAEDGSILIAENFEDYGKNICELYNIKLDKIVSGSSQDGGYIFSCVPLTGTKAYVVCLESSNKILRDIAVNLLYYLLISILLSLLCIFLSNRILIKIYNPINRVVQTFKYVLPRNENLIEEDIAIINKYMQNSLSESNQDTLDESTKNALLQIRKSQLYTLHSQISPHFLGNALTVIKYEVGTRLGIDNEIEKSLSTLSKFLSESIHYNRIITSIREEIDRVDEYIKICELCFIKNLQIFWDIDDGIKDCSIIAFTLQPIIENSVVHGFTPQTKSPKINIMIYPEEENIRISIYDNGKGIEANTLHRIKRTVYDEEQTGHHIGMKNVHMKIKLLYGEQYGITNISSDFSGTSVDILIPRYFMDKDV